MGAQGRVVHDSAQVNVGLVGRNGAGKSTLLRLIGGTDTPSRGCIERQSCVSWPMGFGGGLQDSLTGRRNAKFVCRILGHDDEMDERLAFMQDCAEIGASFDQPVKTCSSGMTSRLQFAMSLAFDFDVYIADEVISTGDAAFRGKANKAFKNLADRASRIMVSHSDSTLREFCSDGDVIFVAPRQNTVRVTGLAANAKRFEFAAAKLSIDELAKLAKPAACATYVRVVRNSGIVRNTDYYALAAAREIRVGNGDDVEFTADKKPGTIAVRVEGEHQSQQEYVLPYGSRMGALLGQVRPTPLSDAASIQLYRVRVRERQRAMLQTSMRSLESTVLTARSGTNDEAVLRKQEAELILQWVERAKKVEPSGQVQVASSASRDELVLENGDVIRIPARRPGAGERRGTVPERAGVRPQPEGRRLHRAGRGLHSKRRELESRDRAPRRQLRRRQARCAPARRRRSAGAAEGRRQIAPGLQGHDADYLPGTGPRMPRAG
jgi:ABC-type Na+ transport system ATPase subunit NatA